MPELEFEEFLNTPFSFTDRGTPFPANRRPVWRLGIIILLLKFASRSSSSSLRRLHVLDWAIRSEEGRQRLISFLSKTSSPSFTPIRYDPAVLRAIQFARAEGLVDVASGTIRLTGSGERLADDIFKQEAIFAKQRPFIEAIKKRFSERSTEEFLSLGAG